MAIDVGIDATLQSSNISNYTFVEEQNPANATGTLDHLEVYCGAAGTGTADFGSFYVVSGANLSTRDTALGLAVGAALNTFDAPGDFTAFNINIGDYIGVSVAGMGQRYKTSTGTGVWIISGDYVPCTNQAFTYLANWRSAIYATGVEAGGGGLLIPIAMHHYKMLRG